MLLGIIQLCGDDISWTIGLYFEHVVLLGILWLCDHFPVEKMRRFHFFLDEFNSCQRLMCNKARLEADTFRLVWKSSSIVNPLRP